MPKPPRYYTICCSCGFAGFIVNRPLALYGRLITGLCLVMSVLTLQKKILKKINCDIRCKKEKVHVGRNTKLRVIVDSYLYVVGGTSSYVAVLR
jgi:hypothetical protein